MTRRPRAFRLDAPDVASGSIEVVDEPFDAIEAADGVVVPMGEKRRAPWVGILVSALSGLLMLGLGLGIEKLIADLYVIAPWLGWVALGLTLLAALAFLAIVGREAAGIWREKKIERLREAALDALSVKDHQAAKTIVADLVALYDTRASAAQGRARLRNLDDEIIDADDRLAIAERELLSPLDAQAKRAIAAAAKQVSLVTAVSPRAIVDVAFVIFAAVRLLRTLARIYGGRPGLFGFLRLAKAAFNHLAVTGGMAVGDSLMQQVLGLGLAARISAKLGEGVLNGLMTARFGLAAIAVCRPLPFIREDTPRIGDVAGELVSRAEAAATPQG
ncbi:YcjF family protein [Microvirga sp. 2MCAF38]|uniref:YcjF family protein n=1 Tax=Microvirga sp. 2MCAF38 TaxID=3232989 RepID=UPI003F9B6F74